MVLLQLAVHGMSVPAHELCSCKLLTTCACVQAAAHVRRQDRQQASKAVSCFLELIRAEFRDRKHLYMVHSVLLFGVDSLKRLLHDGNM